LSPREGEPVAKKIPKRIEFPDHRTKERRERDHTDGVCYVDADWESPNFVEQYVLAASELADRMRERPPLVDDLGLPLLYLVRHATELILKALLADALEVGGYRKILDVEHGYDPPWNAKRDLDSSHDLGRLRDHLIMTLKHLRFDQVNDSLLDLVKEVIDAEKKNETAFRYPHFRKMGRTESAFTEPTRFPVLLLQRKLDLAFKENMGDQFLEPDDERFQCKLWKEQHSLMQLEGTIEHAREQKDKIKTAFADTVVDLDRWLGTQVDANHSQAAAYVVCRKKIRELLRERQAL
jgi:hypothetical protein